VKQEWVDRAPTDLAETMIVWSPMIPGDNEAAAREAARRFEGATVAQFWDPENRAGTAYRSSVFPNAYAKVAAALPADHWLRGSLSALAEPYKNGPEWDIYMFFARGVHWNESAPRPTRFVRHMGRQDGDQRSLMWIDDYASAPLMGSLGHEIRTLGQSMIER
jgi:hypothetical protein